MLRKMSSLKNNHGFMKYFKNTSWLFFEKILRMIVGISIGVWVARYLGPDQFGLLNYVQSFVALFLVFSTLGLDAIVVRDLVKNESNEDFLMGTVFILKLIGACLLLLLLPIVVQFTSNDQYTNSLIYIVAMAAIFQSFNVIDFYFQSKVLSKYVVYANSITLFISSIIKIALILFEAPLIAFVWMVVIDSIVLALGYIYFYLYKENHFNKWKFSVQIAKKLLKDSWPLIITGMAIMIQSRIDQVMIKEMINNNEVGQYSVAMRMIEIFDILAVIVVKSLMPSITNAKKISETLYNERLYFIYRLMMIFFLITGSFVFLFGEKFILLLYGNEYMLASTLFPLFAIRTFFTNYGVARGAFITNNNLFKVSMIFVIITSMINIVLNYFLIPIMQAKGALIATIISSALFVFVFNFFNKDTRNNGMLMVKSIFTFYTLRLKDIR